MRNLDITTLRSFVAVADLGGVTKAAGFLNLTQSAVSMQLKRLEEMMGIDFLDRSGRGIALTPAGEQLLGYARRMIALNDEIVRRLADEEYEGEISIGVPHDIIYPAIPAVLKQLRSAYPRIQVNMVSSNTSELIPQFQKGEFDLILTTEPTRGGEQLCSLPLTWMGAKGGATWRRRPLRIAGGRICSFRPRMLAALEEAGIEWENAVDTASDRTVEVTVAADMAVCVMIEGTEPPHLEIIDHGGALPEVGTQFINMYGAEPSKGEVINHFADLLRQGFGAFQHRNDPNIAQRRIG
ncbi:LysR family transcriptional regulator [Cognatishimia sp. D5M38]|uniref:LysR family transcriptional regulator n=2 Tax=Cognatishimia TaxID=2211635 RepID=A0A975END5_9RHOB|nr:LysR family transcriptional regulator [Cognatishimia activa]QTN35266.1 LysR family transcriptional regulator [Cognatishimia activa]